MINQPEIELTVEDITEGSKYTRKLKLVSKNPSYNGKTIEYRALKGSEFELALQRSEIGKDQNPAESYRFLLEACRMGIVTPGIGAKVGQLDEDIVTQIGGIILGVTNVTAKAVENFSTPLTDS